MSVKSHPEQDLAAASLTLSLISPHDTYCSMREQLSARSEKTVKVGQEAMKLLYKEPIKEAVKETLAEEGLVSQQTAEQTQSNIADRLTPKESSTTQTKLEVTDSESADSGSSLLSPKVVIPAVALLGVALAIRRLGEGSLETEKLEEIVGKEDDTAMEDDMSKSTPSDSNHSEFSDDDATEVNV